MGTKEEIDKNGDVHLLTGQACWALKNFAEEFLEKDRSMEGLENTESYAYVSLIPLLVLVSAAWVRQLDSWWFNGYKTDNYWLHHDRDT